MASRSSIATCSVDAGRLDHRGISIGHCRNTPSVDGPSSPPKKYLPKSGNRSCGQLLPSGKDNSMRAMLRPLPVLKFAKGWTKTAVLALSRRFSSPNWHCDALRSIAQYKRCSASPGRSPQQHRMVPIPTQSNPNQLAPGSVARSPPPPWDSFTIRELFLRAFGTGGGAHSGVSAARRARAGPSGSPCFFCFRSHPGRCGTDPCVGCAPFQHAACHLFWRFSRGESGAVAAPTLGSSPVLLPRAAGMPAEGLASEKAGRSPSPSLEPLGRGEP